MTLWKFHPADKNLTQTLSRDLSLHPVAAQLMAHRGITTAEEGNRFLNPSLKDLPNPFLLPDMEKGVDRLVTAIRRREKIGLFGDYDVDGITAVSLAVFFFREIGVEIETYIPDRLTEGYGLNPKAMEKLKSAGVSLVVTADCGSKSHESIRRANEIGLEVIVTDHHQVDGELPAATALINPQRDVVGRELSGVGVLFFLLLGLRQKMREAGLFSGPEPNLKKHLDLVAFGTVADMVPLTGINRVLVTFGLRELAITEKPGLIALKEISKLSGKTVDTSDIGFRLAPRINAGGRIGQSRMGLQLLTEGDMDRARKWALLLDHCNTDRKTAQEKHLREARQQVAERENRFGLVVASEDWHPGIVGLVAGKLCEEHYRPAVALSLRNGIAKGSARSIDGIHIVEVLGSCADLLEQFGGHQAAAGLTLPVSRLEAFISRFENLIREEQDLHGKIFERTLSIDAHLPLAQIDPPLLEQLERLRPFGIGNPPPLFTLEGARFSEIKTVGKEHLKMKVSHNSDIFPAIAFQWGGRGKELKPEGRIAFTPEWNEYQGARTLQIKIKDIAF